MKPLKPSLSAPTASATLSSTAPTPPPGSPDFVSTQLLRELKSLNLRFVELLCNEHQVQLRLQGDHHDRLLALHDNDRMRLATCPYSLFELNLSDTAWWQNNLYDKHTNSDYPPACINQFTLASLIYAHRLALENVELAGLLLGMNQSVSAIFQQLTIGQLMDCTANMAERLKIRLINDPNFWPDLVNYVKEESGDKYIAAQTSALQIMAARL